MSKARGKCQQCGNDLPPRVREPWTITRKNKVRKWCSNKCRQAAWWATLSEAERKKRSLRYRRKHNQTLSQREANDVEDDDLYGYGTGGPYGSNR